MKKVIKLYSNIKKEQEWLTSQKGWKLVKTNGISYTFEESSHKYDYEYIFYDKGKKELEAIRKQITDNDIEFVCNSSFWALFRKDVKKGEIHIYADTYLKYKMLMKKYKSYISLGVSFLCLATTYMSLAFQLNNLLRFVSPLLYLCSSIYFITSSYYKKYAMEYDDGSYASRMKNDK